jgi:CRISPR/Cas system endoribonuclease Cas6 (RAMP superfamily)
MKLGGIVGEALFRGDMKDFLPLVKLGEFVHIGKAVTFGLGKYVVV